MSVNTSTERVQELAAFMGKAQMCLNGESTYISDLFLALLEERNELEALALIQHEKISRLEYALRRK